MTVRQQSTSSAKRPIAPRRDPRGKLGSSDSQATPIKASATVAKKKVADKPKRALTAYNIYTAYERERILNGTDQIPGNKATLADVKRVTAQLKIKKRRIHRKSHGLIGFHDLSKLIAQRWKDLPQDERKLFDDQAITEKIERQEYLERISKVKSKDDEEAPSPTISGSIPMVAPIRPHLPATAAPAARVVSPSNSQPQVQRPSPTAAPTYQASSNNDLIAATASLADSLAKMTGQVQNSLGIPSQDSQVLAYNLLTAMVNAQKPPAAAPSSQPPLHAGSSSGPSSSNCQALLGSMLSAMNQNRSQESSSTQAPRPVASSQSDAATALIKQAPRPSPAPGPQDISASDSLEPRPFSPTEHQEAAAAVSANSSVAPVEGMAEATTKHVQPTSDLAEAPQDPLKIWENLISDDEDWSRSSNEQQSLNATHTHSQDKLGLPLDDELLLAGDDQAPDLEELLADESFLESVPMQVETSWTPADFPDAQSMMRANRLDFELLDPLMSDSLYPLGPGP